MRRTVLLCISILLLAAGPLALTQERRVEFQLSGVSLRAALDSLRVWFPFSLVYLDRDVEGKTVSSSCQGCAFEEALDALLAGTSLTWARIGDQYVLRERPLRPVRALSTVAGSVLDTVSGLWLQDALVVLRDSARGEVRRWCSTNAAGFYSLRNVEPGRYTLNIRAVGYRPLEEEVVVAGTSLQLDRSLIEESITLQEVTVEGRRATSVPAEGLARGIFIRSAPAEQTQYLLDGTRIYNPAHFGGVLSTFSPEALSDVERGIGGLSPYYGGRIGGVLDLALREGGRGRLGGVAGTGSLGSHLALDGPLGGETSFLLSGRRGYPDVQVPSLADHGTPGRLGSTEVIAKLSHRLSPEQRLYFSAYVGRDGFSNAVEGAGLAVSNHFSWGNGAASLRWIGIASPSLFLQGSASYSRYSFDAAHEAGGAWPLPADAASSYAVEDVTLRAHAEHFYDESHTIRGGVELVRHRMTGRVSSFASQVASFTAPADAMLELSVYGQDQWRILPGVSAELGARATVFAGTDRSSSSIDPRFSLLISASERTRVFASLTSVTQYIHPYRASGIFALYPTVFWYPSEGSVGPSTSLQLGLGIQRDGEVTVFTAETFYETTRNLHDVASLADVPAGGDLSEALLSGTGRSYGVELSVRKRTGDLTGAVSYTLARAEQRFARLGGGAYVPSRFDRTHEIQAEIEYRPDDAWLFGILGVLVSGEAPVSSVTFAAEVEHGPQGASRFPLEMNGSKLPGFQRLELKAVYGFLLDGFNGQLALRFVNGYGLLDPIAWELRPEADVRLLWRARVREMKLFPLFPTLGLTVRF